jgi:hypothetical protein
LLRSRNLRSRAGSMLQAVYRLIDLTVIALIFMVFVGG